jgi:DNA-binding transcriptional regulator YdaS (Cro superfamily)
MEAPKNFNKLLLEFGTTKEIAQKLDVSLQSVYLWAKADKVPTRYLKTIESLTEGRIQPKDLRPELALPNFNKPGVIPTIRMNASFDEGEEDQY